MSTSFNAFNSLDGSTDDSTKAKPSKRSRRFGMRRHGQSERMKLQIHAKNRAMASIPRLITKSVRESFGCHRVPNVDAAGKGSQPSVSFDSCESGPHES